MGRKISFEEFVTKCDEQYNNRFYYFGCTFTSMKDHVHMFDKEKQIFTKQIASRHYLGELPRASRTITFQEFLVKMKGFFGDRFTFSEDSFDSGTHSLVKFEDKLGNKYEYIASYLLKGRLPPEINPRAKGKKSHSINLIHIFEFENLNKWKKKIANYLKNPDMYTTAYSNCKRSVKGYTCYGQSYIKRTY